MVEGPNSVMYMDFRKQLKRPDLIGNLFVTGNQRVGGNPVLSFQKFEVSSTCRMSSLYSLHMERVNVKF